MINDKSFYKSMVKYLEYISIFRIKYSVVTRIIFNFSVMRELFLSAVAFLAVIASVVSLDTGLKANQCLSGRFSPHECICSLYYECINGVIYERTCPAGQEFDMNKKTCVPAKDAICYQPDDQVYCPQEGNAVIPDKNNCGRYYECNDGEKTEKVCSDGLSFSEELGICTWPPSIDCQVKTRVASPFSFSEVESKKGLKCPAKGHVRLPHECLSTSYYECNNGVMIGKECPHGLIYDCVKEACDYPDAGIYEDLWLTQKFDCPSECTPNGNKLIRHETNCSYFYRCSGNQKKLDKCIVGRYFNCLLQTCDLPENTDCTEVTTYPPPTTTIDTGCPRCDCGLIRYSHSDCSMYYECENGVKKLKQCPTGLYYDDERKICDYLENVNCTKPGCKEGEKTPHQCQCDRYYVCQNGEKVVELCPSGKHFDADRKVCDDPDKAHCQLTNNHCIGKCSSSSSTENLPHEDCRKYCKCNQGVSTPMDCPKNKIYDTETKLCQFPENVKNPQCEPFPCDSNTLLPHQCYCDRYFQCRNRTKILQWCEDGKHFDYETQSCVLCKDAHCFAARVPSRLEGCKQSCASNVPGKFIAHENCEKYCTCNDCKGQKINDCPPYRYYNPKTGQCDRPENIVDLSCEPFPCVPGSDGDLPHECDCSLYYRCENGKRKERHCPEGMKFDYDTFTCVQAGAHCYYKNSSSIYNLEGKKVGCVLVPSDIPIVQ